MDELLNKAIPSRSNVEKVLNATAEIGRASGLEAAAKLFREMANHKGRVVGTNDLREAAEALEEAATKLRARSSETLAQHKL